MIPATLYAGLPLALSREDEQQLLKQDKTRLDVRDKLLMHAMRDALKYAATVSGGKIDHNELMSLCAIALMQAIKNYDSEHPRHLTLLQFCKPFIRGQVRRYWRSLNVVRYGSELPVSTATESAEDALEGDAVDPEWDYIHARERWEWVKPHYQKLTETERRVLTFIFESRFTMAEIGVMLNCTRQNIEVTKRRAFVKIRNGLYRDGKWLDR